MGRKSVAVTRRSARNIIRKLEGVIPFRNSENWTLINGQLFYRERKVIIKEEIEDRVRTIFNQDGRPPIQLFWRWFRRSFYGVTKAAVPSILMPDPSHFIRETNNYTPTGTKEDEDHF